MLTHKIAVIAGDGIGPEVIDEGIKVLTCFYGGDDSVTPEAIISAIKER